MQYNSKLELVFYTSYSRFFLSLYKDVEITIRELKTRNTIFVVE